MERAPTNKKRRFLSIALLLILGPVALEIWYPGAVTDLPVLRDVKVRWYAGRLGDSDPKIQASAALALGKMGPKARRAVPALIEALEARRSEVRGAAEQALRRIRPGAEAVPALIETWGSSRSEVRDAAVRALGEIGRDAEAARAITEALTRAMKDRNVSPYATGALVKIADAGLESFLSALEDEETPERHAPDVKEPESRGTAVERVLRLMADREDMEGFGAEVIRKMGEPALESLFNASKDEDARVRRAAVMALQRIVSSIRAPETRARVAKALINASQDEDVRVREAAARAMQGILPAIKVPETRARVAKALINALQDEDVPVRRTAAAVMQHVLPAVKDPQILARAAEALIRALNDSDSEVRGLAPVALGKTGEPGLEPLLRIVLEPDTQERTRIYAASALRDILRTSEGADWTPRITEPLIDRLEDETQSAAVRAQLASALGQILSGVKDPVILQTAAAALVKALKDDSQQVRENAASALGNIPSRGADHQVTGKAIEALLDQEIGLNSDTVSLALSELLKKGGAEARENVQQYLSKSDAPFVVRLTAALSLAQSGESSPLVTKTITQALQDDEQPLGIARILLRMSRFEGDLVEYINPLYGLFGNKDDYVRRTAAQRMAELGEPALPVILQACRSDVPTIQISGLSALNQFCYSVMEQKSPSRSKYRRFRRELWSESTEDLLERVSPVLHDLLKADNPSVVSWALRAIEPFGDEGRRFAAEVPVKPLLARLEDRNENYWVRGAAAQVLGKIVSVSKSLESARTTVPLLIVALQGERQSLHFYIVALGRIVSAVEDPELARKAVPPLITALRDDSRWVRHAAESLGRIFAAVPNADLAETAIQPLLAALEDADSDSEGKRSPRGSSGTRSIFAWALIQIATEKAREAVRNAGFDPDQPPTLPIRRSLPPQAPQEVTSRRTPTSIEEFRKALELRPKDHWLHETFGAFLIKKKNHEQAFSELRLAFELNRSCQRTRSFIGDLVRALLYDPESKDLKRALSYARLLVEETGGKDSGMLSLLKQVEPHAAFAAGRRTEAISAIEETLRREGLSEAVRRQLDDYRAAVLPDLLTYASIDAAIDALGILVPRGAVWRYFPGIREPSPGLEWTEEDFDDSTWMEGRSGFGYGDNDDRTRLDDMTGSYSTLYIRRFFELKALTSKQKLQLLVWADDGVVAYVNGVGIGRANAGGAGTRLSHDAVATGQAGEPLMVHEFPLEPGVLRPGRNVLALQGLNISRAGSSDFSLIPVLHAEHEFDLQRDRARFAEFQKAARGEDAPRRLAYLEGRLLQHAGKYRQAAEEFREIWEKDRSRPEPLERLGESLRQAGEKAAAISALIDALKDEHENVRR